MIGDFNRFTLPRDGAAFAGTCAVDSVPVLAHKTVDGAGNEFPHDGLIERATNE